MTFPLRPHRAFLIAAACGLAGLLVGWFTFRSLAVVIAADIFFALYLLLSLVGIPRLTADYLKRHAAREDEPVWIIFAVTLATVIVAVISLFLLINQAPSPDPLRLALTLVSVPLGWFTIHTMAALHYAHLYWQPAARPGEDGLSMEIAARGGLDLPGSGEPSGADFLYFAYTIGMTAQTSDVEVTNTAMRIACLVHSIVSFYFNTVLVAAAVNLAVSLGH